MPRFISELKRTHTCGQLTDADLGKEVVLFGWVNNRRDHGGAVFIDLRDREGLTQVVFEEDVRPEVHGLAGELRLEYCLGVRGKVVSRGSNVNPKMKTGAIEVHATDLEIFNRSEPTPFPIEDKIDTNEEKRLQSRVEWQSMHTATCRARYSPRARVSGEETAWTWGTGMSPGSSTPNQTKKPAVPSTSRSTIASTILRSMAVPQGSDGAW